jgi:hypothetical protein
MERETAPISKLKKEFQPSVNLNSANLQTLKRTKIMEIEATDKTPSRKNGSSKTGTNGKTHSKVALESLGTLQTNFSEFSADKEKI